MAQPMAAASTGTVTPLPLAGSAPAILTVDDIARRFDTAEGAITALDDVSFTVSPGEFLALIGPVSYTHLTLPTTERV